MAKLPEAVKAFIVTRLAQYDTPTDVATAVKAEYGLEIDRRQVQLYDPARAGEKPAKKWVVLHAKARAAFLDDVSDIPIAQRSFRLARLDRMARAAEEKKNYALAAQLHEQAAKEIGGAFTNKRELTGAGGSAIGPLLVQFVEPEPK